MGGGMLEAVRVYEGEGGGRVGRGREEGVDKGR